MRRLGSSGDEQNRKNMTTVPQTRTRDSRVLKIVAVGFSAHAHAALEMLLHKQSVKTCELVSDIDIAHVGIVDLDGFQARQLFEDYRQRFGGPTLVMSVRDPAIEGMLWVAKPAQASTLLAALESTRAVAFSEPVAADTSAVAPPADPAPVDDAVEGNEIAANDIAYDEDLSPADSTPGTAPVVHPRDRADSGDTSHAANLAQTERRRHPSYGSFTHASYTDPSQRHLCFYDPREYFQGVLKRAIDLSRSKQQPLRMTCLNDAGKGLTIFPVQHRIQNEIREHLLRRLSMVSGSDNFVDFRLLHKDTQPTATSLEPRTQTESGLLWKVALWAAMGRIPVGTDPEQPVRLVYWPNFTRIFIPHHAMQIAALWAQRPTSLLETADMLGIERRYVFSFYSAALAIGAVAHAGESQRSATADKRPGQRGLLGRLLNYLGSRD